MMVRWYSVNGRCSVVLQSDFVWCIYGKNGGTCVVFHSDCGFEMIT